MTSTKLAIHIPDLRGGGAERMMVALANEFSLRGISTDLVLSRSTGPYLSEVDAGVNVVDLDAPRYPGYSAMGSFLPLRRYLRSVRPDTLLSALSRANIVALLANRLSGTETRIVVSERNHLSTRIEQMGDIRFQALPHLIKFTYPWADAIIPISGGVATDLASTTGISRKEMITIHNPAFPSNIEEHTPEPPDHRWFESSTGENKLILGVGSLSTQKDFPTLLRAFDQLIETRSAHLIILGEGDKRENLSSLSNQLEITDQVDFPGFVENPFAYMKWADVFVLSSKWEGFGNVLVEAMACGTPVVSTDCPSGPAEILEHGYYGPLVPVGDYEGLAKAINDTLDNPPPSEVLRKRAEDFRVELIADQYLDVLFPDRDD